MSKSASKDGDWQRPYTRVPTVWVVEFARGEGFEQSDGQRVRGNRLVNTFIVESPERMMAICRSRNIIVYRIYLWIRNFVEPCTSLIVALHNRTISPSLPTPDHLSRCQRPRRPSNRGINQFRSSRFYRLHTVVPGTVKMFFVPSSQPSKIVNYYIP